MRNPHYIKRGLNAYPPKELNAVTYLDNGVGYVDIYNQYVYMNKQDWINFKQKIEEDRDAKAVGIYNKLV